ncbi:Cdc6/Cdc18 family protein [Haloarcula litorea]|uniref:Cdc6/Cdc18 family protein n=1 Tax=Haloarcula litorea TaxID=3032579 RepID=UPI0023E7B772|nr:AAA family ATPase [Halomicroarcula sp. GDY20]
MDIEERIRRRRPQVDGESLVRDYTALSPAAHIEDPVDRGPAIERLLTHFDPVFEDETPPPLYLSGPPGSGKSAIVTALFRKLSALPETTRPVVHTSTRVRPSSSPAFVYLDSRRVDSEFAFYRTILDSVVEESVPERGVGTATLRDRLHERRGRDASPVVVAIDHLDGHGAAAETVVEWVDGLPATVALVGVGRSPPSETAFGDVAGATKRLSPYRRQQLADLLTRRASLGLREATLGHAAAEPIVEWAEGNAHDALAALFVAADRADRHRGTLDRSDTEAAVDRLSKDAVALDRVLSLPANRLAVLRALVDLDPAERSSVEAATDAVTASLSTDLSRGTVKRFIYEAAEDGILDRVKGEPTPGIGRVPSRVEPRFPTAVFRRLYDLEHE